MSISETGNGAVPTKDQLIEKIRGIYENEKFKLDAYFFCGFPSGTPNETLIKICEEFFKNEEAGNTDHDVINNMIKEMEATVAIDPGTGGANNVVDSSADMKEVIANKDLLLA